ncbi:MAG: ROK family protein, partial [Clostridia bacterium]|nr:ROK family protein [Clostridia bacterium]
MHLGAIEAGGTKMVLAVADEKLNILFRKTLPTQSPEETMPQMIAFFGEHPVEALGIGSFGPVDLNPASSTFGY